ncbi:FlgK family flagellar hook-associated protein [Rickettsia endosymbiont of Cardiosporidium cionae]|uniref:FlgK family flagellar hook-associated protein n=1 Tax=Rickettsia endosymbiont of Cardiosporidium cionae TaxID=2777155 RepID=UPI001895B5B1|nr:hypothetical protein [Rickettsia endosymbiont of Cardiosporidium cionae]KAF8818277.1 hypothetical protein IHI24_000736 [Rickettsia endosymbiont of Cardiosporidium cionae]
MPNEIIVQTQAAQENNRKIQNIYAENLSNASDPNTRNTEVITVSTPSLHTNLTTSEVVTRRSHDPNEDHKHRQLIAENNFLKINAAFADEILPSILDSAKNLIYGSKISNEINKLLNLSNALISENVTSDNKNRFIQQFSEMVNCMNSISENITKSFEQVEFEIENSISHINKSIKEIFQYNHAKSDSNKEKIAMHRDSVVNKLFEEIGLIYKEKNSLISLRILDGANLVTNNHYIQFEYAQDPKSKNPLINLVLYDINDNAKKHISTSYNLENFVQKVNYGKLKALQNIKNNTLPNIQKSHNEFTKDLINTINTLYNDTIALQSKHEIRGNKTFHYLDKLQSDNEFNIYLGSNDEDKNLNINSNNIKHVAKLEFSDENKTLTMQQIIDNLNYQLDFLPSQKRATLGEFQLNSSSTSSQYLINNIILNILPIDNQSTDLSVNIDFRGNSYFGSEIELLSISSPGKTLFQNDLKNTILRLEKNSNKKLDAPIKLTGFKKDTVQDITLKIKIKGDNNVINTGSIVFKLDPSKMGSGYTNIGCSNKKDVEGDFQLIEPEYPNAIAKATLRNIDSNLEIQHNKIAKGYLSIKSNNNNYRLLYQGRDFATKNGFNNLLEYDDSANLIIKQEILNNPSSLSTYKVVTKAINQNISIGDTAAKAKITFNDTITNFSDKDSIIIDNQKFIFSKDPSLETITNKNTEYVILGTDFIQSTTNLSKAINNNMLLSKKLRADYDPTALSHIIEISTLSGGTWGNNTEISAQLDIASTLKLKIHNNHFDYSEIAKLTGGSNINSNITCNKQIIGDAHAFFKDIRSLQQNKISSQYQENSNLTLIQYASTTYTEKISGMLLKKQNEYKASQQLLNIHNDEIHSKHSTQSKKMQNIQNLINSSVTNNICSYLLKLATETTKDLLKAFFPN